MLKQFQWEENFNNNKLSPFISCDMKQMDLKKNNFNFGKYPECFSEYLEKCIATTHFHKSSSPDERFRLRQL